jgi:hypothetical protein
MGYPQRTEVLIVPIGTLFAFPQLRTTLPEVPEGMFYHLLNRQPTDTILWLASLLVSGFG